MRSRCISLTRFVDERTGRAGLPIGAVLAAVLCVPLPCQDGTMLDDTSVTDAVMDEFFTDHAVPAHLISAHCDDGILTLQGTADNVMAAERAARIARTVKGVRAVVNRIEVDPPAQKSAAGLRSDVEAALLADPATDSFEVDVSCDQDGRVELGGTVQSWAERSLCGKVAKSVAGVQALDNRIEVDYRTDRTDVEIQTEVDQRLRWDVLLDDGLVTVTCDDGAVKLEGTVGSAAERIRARNHAWVAGVTSVDDTGLMVKRWARDDDRRKTTFPVRGDDEIRRAVQDALAWDPRVMSFDVQSEVAGGVVTLRGTVDNLKARRAAESDARNTVGALRVVNRLRVQPSDQRSAVATAQDVREALLRDPWVNRYDVTVSVRNGIAHLYGTVDSNFERACADDAASRVNGVVDVCNHLRVHDDSLVFHDPYVDAWPVHTYSWYEYSPPLTFDDDADILAAVQDQLWWSPFVDSSDLTVEVEDGVVTLRGEVDGRSERMAAVQNAYDGGATKVIDRLETRRPKGDSADEQ